MPELTTYIAANEGELFEILIHRNLSGEIPSVVGLDRHAQPFLAYLAGVDGDRVGIVDDDPRTSDYDIEGVSSCDHCGAFEERGLAAHRYPVTIIAAVSDA